MAVLHPLVWKSQCFAAKRETTTGTAIALSASDGQFNFIGDVKLDPDYKADPRQAAGSMSKRKATPGGAAATVETTVEIANTGTATAPQWFSLLTGCGFSISGSVATVASGSATADTYTCGHYIDGVTWTAAGCMFDLEISAESGKYFAGKLTGKGVWQPPTDVALITPTFETGAVPVFVNTTLTIGGSTYIVPRFNLKMNSDVQLREDGASGSSAGFRSAVIVDRDPVFEVDVEASLLATKNWYTTFTAQTEAALSLAIGSGTNQVVTIGAPALQLRNSPVKVNKNGIAYYTLTYGLNTSVAAGDNEMTITLS